MQRLTITHRLYVVDEIVLKKTLVYLVPQTLMWLFHHLRTHRHGNTVIGGALTWWLVMYYIFFFNSLQTDLVILSTDTIKIFLYLWDIGLFLCICLILHLKKESVSVGIQSQDAAGLKGRQEHTNQPAEQSMSTDSIIIYSWVAKLLHENLWHPVLTQRCTN